MLSQASAPLSSISSPATSEPPTHFDLVIQDAAARPEQAGGIDPATQTAPDLPASGDVFTEEEFMEFYASVFNISSAFLDLPSLAVDTREKRAIEGFNSLYRIADRHPRLRWIIRPMNDDLKDGAVAFAFFGGMAKGVADDFKVKRDAKKEKTDETDGMAPTPPDQDYKTRAGNASTVLL